MEWVDGWCRMITRNPETVKKEIMQLKNNRAAGKDRLPGELFKYGGEKLARALHLVISKI